MMEEEPIVEYEFILILYYIWCTSRWSNRICYEFVNNRAKEIIESDDDEELPSPGDF